MATNKRITLGVNVQVDNSSLSKLKEELTQIQNAMMIKGTKNGYTDSIKETLKVANQLEEVLNSSWNSRLGQLDLSKVNSKMKEMNLTAKNVKLTLSEYPQVWDGFTKQILRSNVELTKSSALLDKMAITMANTVRYGISSSVFNRMTNSLSHAYNYAKNLDKSLNDIRIVSEASADQMERFAKNANSAAKQLGASTLDYTNAALIYYQQGLSNEEIVERTNTTIKMANVLGASAKEVSDYMTAIWNNFDNGSESLEHYGDVITALGASTASSAEEIAEGLEKFASISNTVGLSYDYATTALATVVAATRQSADVVGTAFKTLFARIQGLNLGETLDDGTTLNKYSEALDKVGINIMNQSGELKNMDDILDEMGAKWTTLSKAQQVALAETVAGTRQYSQLIALMDNWDTFKQNLTTAQEASGTLAKKQEIYLDSVEAHLQKLSTEAEKTYKTLFDEEAVKSFADVATFALSRINDYLTGLGGGINSLATLGFQTMGLFSTQIGRGLSTSLENQRAQQTNEASFQEQEKIITEQGIKAGHSNENIQEEIELSKKLLDVRKNLTQEQYKESKEQIIQISHLKTQLDNYENINTELKSISEKHGLDESDSSTFGSAAQDAADKIDILNNKIQELETEIDNVDTRTEKMASLEIINKYKKEIENLTKDYEELSDAAQRAAQQESNAEDNNNKQKEHDYLKESIERKTALAAEAEELRLLTKGFSLLGSTITSAFGVFSTLFNENLSGWEKFKSIITVILAQSVNLIANWKDLGNSFKQVGTFFKTLGSTIAGTVTKTGAQVAANKAVVASNKKVEKSEKDVAKAKKKNAQGSKEVVISETQEIGVNKAVGASSEEAAMGVEGLATSIGTVIAELLPFIAIAALVVGAGVAIHQMWTEDARAAEEAAEAAKKATENYNAIKNLYQEIKNDIKDYSSQVKALEELTRGTEEWKDAVEALSDKLDELLVKYPELAKYVITENGVQKLNTAGEARLNEIKSETKTLKFSAAAAKTQADIRAKKTSYYSTSTDFSREMALNSKSGNASTSLVSLLGNLIAPGVGGLFAGAASLGTRLGQTDTALRSVASKYRNNISAVLAPENKEEIIQTIMSSSQMSREQAAELATQIQNKENFDKLTELASSQNNYLDSINDYTKAIAQTVTSDYIGNKKEAIEEETERIVRSNQKKYEAEYQDASLQKLADTYLAILKQTDAGATAEETSSSWEKFKRNIGYNPEGGTIKFTTGDQSVEYDYQALKDAVVSYFVTQDTDYYMREHGIKTVESYYDRFDKRSGEEGFGDFVYDTKYHLDQLAELYSKEDLEKFKKIYNKFFNIDSETGEKLDAEKGTIDASSIGINAALQSALSTPDWRNKQIDKYAIDGKGQQLQTKATSLVNSSIKGELTSENLKTNKDYESIQNELKNLLKIYPELTEEAKVFNNTNLVGTAQWKNSLYSIQTAINNINIANAQKKLQEFYKEHDKNNEDGGFQIEINDEQFQSDMEDLLDADYELTVAISAQTDNAFEQAFDSLGDIDTAINKIQEGFQVSKDDIVALSEAIPGIAENYTIAANGLVQLDEATAKSAIASAQVRAEANLEETKADLELTAQSFEAKAEAYDALANIAQQVVDGQIEGEEAEAAIEEKLAIIQQEQDNETAINEQQASADSTSVVLNNTQSLMRADQDYTDQFLANAKIRGQAEEWASLGNWRDIQGLNTRRGSVTRDITSQVTQEGSITQEGTASSETSDEKTKWTELAAEYRAMAEQMRTAASKARGQKAALEAFDKTLNLDRLGAGRSKSGSNKSRDFIEDELDRYEKVNAELADISNNLTKIQEQTNKLLGKELIDNLNQQIQLLNQQITVTGEKLKIANEEANEYKQQLAQQYGVSFGADGVAQNYAAVYYAEFARYNSAVASYNSGGLNDEGIKAAEERYKKYNELISKYDTMIGSTIPGLEKSIRDARDKIIEQNIKKFNLEIELRLELSEAERDWNEFKRKVIDSIKDDDILGTAKQKLLDLKTYYNEAGTGEVQALTKQLENALNEYKSFVNGQNGQWYGDQQVQAREDLIKRYDEMKEALEEVVDLQEELHQKLLDMIDEANEKFSEQVDLFEQVGNQIEHDIELINLISGEDDYETLEKFYQMRNKNNLEELDFLRQQKEYWDYQVTQYEEDTEERKKAQENALKANETLTQAEIKSIQDVRTEFENSINKIFKNLNNSLTNNLGLDYINEQWTLMKDNSDMYLDNINRIQGIQDIGQKYMDAINNTSSVSAQKKLSQLREKELKSLQEMDHLSQEDLDRAEKKLNLAIAQAAFEEAQYNKSQMRLSRDSQGNYRYVFTADQDAIDETRKELTAAYEELYNFDKDRYKANLEAAYNAWDEYQQKMAEAALINDPELRAEKEALITSQYQEKLTNITKDNEQIRKELTESTFATLSNLYAIDKNNYELMTDDEKAALDKLLEGNLDASQVAFDTLFDLYTDNTNNFRTMADEEKDIIEKQLIPQWDSGIQHMIDSINAEGGVKEVILKTWEEINTAVEKYNEDKDKVEKASGIMFSSIKTGVDESITKIGDLITKNNDLILKYSEEATAIQKVWEEVDKLSKKYDEAAEKAKALTDETHKTLQEDAEAHAEEYAEATAQGPEPVETTPVTETPAASSLSTNVGGIGSGDGIPNIGDKNITLHGAYHFTSYKGDKTNYTDHIGENDFEIVQISKKSSSFYPYQIGKNGIPYGWVKLDDISGYDTGGYTGSWNSNNGRLAMLHQKELVLNADDTRNILAAVSAVRTLVTGINNPGMILNSGGADNGILEQNVHIEATFPSVTSSKEIEDALNNLVNVASQRVLER